MGKNNPPLRHCKVCAVVPMPPGDTGYCGACAALMTFLNDLHEDDGRVTPRERAADRERRLRERGRIHHEPDWGVAT